MQLCRASARRAQRLALTASTTTGVSWAVSPMTAHKQPRCTATFIIIIFFKQLNDFSFKEVIWLQPCGSLHHCRSSIKHIKQQSEDRTTALYSFNWCRTKLISGGIYSINTKKSAYVNPWILFSPVSFFFTTWTETVLVPPYLSLPLWRAGLSTLTDLIGSCQVNLSRTNPPEDTVPITFLSSAQIPVKHFLE